MDKFVIYAWIALGSALGGVGRFWISTALPHRFESFPWGTLVVNVAGSFLIGFFASLTGPEGRFVAGPRLNHFFMTGLCGGFTTFSAFSLQTLTLARDGHPLHAGLNVLGSVALCLLAVWIGHLTGQTLHR